MAATLSGLAIAPVIDNVQPAASAGINQRTLIVNFTSGASTFNYSASAGLTGILYAQATPIGDATLTAKVANTASTDGTLYPITSGVTFTASATTGASFCVLIISRT